MFPKNKTKQIMDLKDLPVLFCLLETIAHYTDSRASVLGAATPACPCFLTKGQTQADLLVPTVTLNELFGQQTLVPCCGLCPGFPGSTVTCSYPQPHNSHPFIPCSYPHTWPICLPFKFLVPYPRSPLFNSLYRCSPSFRLASHFQYPFSF